MNIQSKMLAGILLAVSTSLNPSIAPIATYAPGPITQEQQRTPDALDAFLRRLSLCESSNVPNLKIVDSNGKYSYGYWMWQESTFIEGITKYNLLPNTEPAEYMNFIYDYDFGMMMARKMIEDGESWRWKNCVRKLGGVPAL